MSKIRTCLIGLGQITEFYTGANHKSGILSSDIYELVGVCDPDENAVSRKYFSKYPFYTNYKTMIKEIKPELCVVSTPDSTHYQIIKYLLENNINCLVEKTFTHYPLQLNKLEEIVNKSNTFVDVLYHFQYSQEVMWIKKNLKKLGKLKNATMIFNEKYDFDEGIPTGMSDSWHGAGINALSILNEFVDLDEYSEISGSKIHTKGKNKQYVFVNKLYTNKQHDSTLNITTDWRSNSKQKIFVFEFEKKTLYVDSHNQQIYCDGKCIFNGKTKYHRMFQQYDFFFTHIRVKDEFKKHLKIQRFLLTL